MPEEPGIGFLVSQQERILAEIGSLRDDMSVLTSIVLRRAEPSMRCCRKSGPRTLRFCE
jgi:hypothetical protein